MRMFMVGGAVRDELMGKRPSDFDFSFVFDDGDVEPGMDPFTLMVEWLQNLGFTIQKEFPEHFTVKAQFPVPTAENIAWIPTGSTMARKGMTADFVLARKEGTYSDGRRPDAVQVGTLEDDLARRDFTMNAIARDDDVLIDPFNGQADIKAGIIRAVGDPLDRLTEDALRAVRALRFSVTLGFEIERSLAFAMETEAVLDRLVKNVSDDRIGGITKDGRSIGELPKMLKFDSVASIKAFNKFPRLTEAIFAGNVSLISSLKTKGVG